MDSSLTAQVILLIVLISLSAFFSMSETALMSLSKVRLRNMVEEKDRAVFHESFADFNHSGYPLPFRHRTQLSDLCRGGIFDQLPSDAGYNLPGSTALRAVQPSQEALEGSPGRNRFGCRLESCVHPASGFAVQIRPSDLCDFPAQINHDCNRDGRD